jgi:integrase
MSSTQNSKNQIFVDYIPAELRENLTWEVVYYVKSPSTNKLIRKRNRVKPLKSINLRRQLGKRMVADINNKLENNIEVFFETNGIKDFASFTSVAKIFLSQILREVKDKNLSEDTYKTYKSRITNLLIYISELAADKMYCSNFNHEFVIEYLDYLRYKKQVSSRTRDNYFTFLVTLSNWLIKKKYIAKNPCEGISKIHKKKNTKITIPKAERELIFNFYKRTNPSFLTFCMCCYYCLVRRTELSKLKVSDVNLKNKTLFISADDSKNNKSAYVTIPPNLIHLLANHLLTAKSNQYLFSNDNYKPGSTQFKPNKATSNWSRMRSKLKINKNIKWYYLKDTGIVDLIIAGVPLNSVRDQARHYSISQTNEYIPRNMKNADTYIINANLNF